MADLFLQLIECKKSDFDQQSDMATKLIMLDLLKYLDKEKVSFERVKRKLNEGRDPAKIVRDVFGDDKQKGGKGYQGKSDLDIFRFLFADGLVKLLDEKSRKQVKNTLSTVGGTSSGSPYISVVY